ncbi:hypothetical protein V1509DRAFT_640670 [Lipomyces kononenkoae]
MFDRSWARACWAALEDNFRAGLAAELRGSISRRRASYIGIWLLVPWVLGSVVYHLYDIDPNSPEFTAIEDGFSRAPQDVTKLLDPQKPTINAVNEAAENIMDLDDSEVARYSILQKDYAYDRERYRESKRALDDLNAGYFSNVVRRLLGISSLQSLWV